MLVIRMFLFAVSLSINLATISRAETSECACISDLASAHARWAATRGWMLLSAAAHCIALLGLVATLDGSAHAGDAHELRKMPMKFSWVACKPNCRGWVSAVGIVTADTPTDFDEFARGRQLGGATIVLDSSGGSVNDSIALGRRWRDLGALTTVGIASRPIPRRALLPAWHPLRIANRCACSCFFRAKCVTCPRLPMFGCIRSGSATAPM